MLDDLQLTAIDGGTRLPVRVTPRARRDAIRGVREGALAVHLTAPPVDGAANDALCRWLGRTVLGVAPSSLTLVSGHTGRTKVVHVAGLTPDEVRARLNTEPP